MRLASPVLAVLALAASGLPALAETALPNGYTANIGDYFAH